MHSTITYNLFCQWKKSPVLSTFPDNIINIIHWYFVAFVTLRITFLVYAKVILTHWSSQWTRLLVSNGHYQVPIWIVAFWLSGGGGETPESTLFCGYKLSHTQNVSKTINLQFCVILVWNHFRTIGNGTQTDLEYLLFAKFRNETSICCLHSNRSKTSRFLSNQDAWYIHFLFNFY